MKKTIYSIFALSLAFFSSCTEEMFESRFQTSGNEITFALEELGTRATPIEDSKALFDAFESFDVVAYNGGTKVFEDVLDENMVAQDKHYWPETTTNYDFFVMPQPTNAYDFTLTDVSSDGSYKFNYQAPTPDGETDGVAAADLVMAHAQANSGQVGLTFEHLLAGVRFVYANPLTAHHVQYVGVQNATMKAQIVYSDGEFNWTSQNGDANLYQAVNADIMKVNSQIHADDAHFMLIPGGSGIVTFSVIMDNDQAYNLEYKKSDLKAGEILTINIGDPASEQTPVEGIGATKEYTKNSDGSYTLRIETYVTGKQEIVTSIQPTDIALLVDVSGSMNDEFYVKQDSRSYSYNDIQNAINDGDEYYYKWGNNYFKLGTEKNGSKYYLTIATRILFIPATYYLRQGRNPGLIRDYVVIVNPNPASSSNSPDGAIWTGVLYKKISKIQATKNAISAFIDQVKANSISGNEHRITLVKFAGDNSANVGDQMYNSNRYNYTQVVKDWVDGSNDFSEIISSVNALTAGGATQAGLGMAHVKNQFEKKDGARAEATKIVVMLTDGSPTANSGFQDAVANTTINSAYSLKQKGAKVWTIYVGAEDESVESEEEAKLPENVDKYMNLVSSNSDNATSMTNGTYTNKGYFNWAKNTDDLEAIFTSISETTGGSSSTTMDENTVLSDVISPVFDLTGVNVNSMDIYYIEQGSDEPIKAGSEISADLSNSTVTVSGFDYSKYFWGTHTDGVKGRKLVIELTLTPKNGLDPGTYVTNGAGSGLYVGGTIVSPFTNATEGMKPTDPNTITIPTKE